MRLYLARHGEAVSEDVAPERPLSPSGLSDVNKVARFLKSTDVSIITFYHSTKKRAQQTAEMMRQTINPSAGLMEKDCLSPNDSTDALFYDISGWQKDTMVVGHLPYLSVMVSRLVASEEAAPLVAFKPASVVILEKDEKNNWSIVSSVNPSSLK